MKITAADIRIQDGRASMRVTLEDGSEQDAIAWFVDELTFTPDDAIGRTVEQLCTLQFERDRAYLQSWSPREALSPARGATGRGAT
jgi:hypothetical protein